MVNVNLPSLNSDDTYSGKNVSEWENDLSSSDLETKTAAESVLLGAVEDLRYQTGIYEDPR